MERHVKFMSIFAVAALIAFIFTSGNALIGNDGPMGNSDVIASERPENLSPAPPKSSGFVFEGCWNFFPKGICWDIYRDSAGDYWICDKCLETEDPGPDTCNRISWETLMRGWWCL